AAIQAIYELAQGLAVLALAYFGVPNAGPSATAHFASAAMYGLIAGGTAIAGRAVAGNSMKAGAAGGASSGYSASGQPLSSSASNPNLTPYTRSGPDSFLSGSRNGLLIAAIDRNTAATVELHSKIGSRSAGDILVIADKQKPGYIAKANAKGIARNTAIGRAQLQTLRVR
ncbi:MAG: hypothetical protein ACRD43_13975, partial [Pyrinomonadaceae bacterium]